MTPDDQVIYKELGRTFGNPPELLPSDIVKMFKSSPPIVGVLRSIYEFYTLQRKWPLEKIFKFNRQNLHVRVSTKYHAPLRAPSWREAAQRMSDLEIEKDLEYTDKLRPEERAEHYNGQLVDMVPVPYKVKRKIGFTNAEDEYIMKLAKRHNLSKRKSLPNKYRAQGAEAGKIIIQLLEIGHGSMEMWAKEDL